MGAALESVVRPDTKLIAITNPNNPSELEAVVAVAERVGAWILADEVYRGTERLTDEITPSLWGGYRKSQSSLMTRAATAYAELAAGTPQ